MLAMNGNEARADIREIRHLPRDCGLRLLLDKLVRGPPI